MKKCFFCLLFPCMIFSQDVPHLLTFGGGAFEIVRHNHNLTTQFQAEFRPGYIWHTVRPTIGFMFTVKGSTYLYGGFGFEWLYKKRFLFSPNFAAGWYSKGGGKDLYFPLEFRSGVDVAWQFRNCSRFGASFYHISNASIGRKNPGVESLVLFFSLPLSTSCCR